MRAAERKKEETILHYMKTLSLTREEAEELWLFDNDKIDNEEVDKLTQKVKDNKIMGSIHGAGHDKTAKTAEKTTKKGRPRKENGEKTEIITKIAEFLMTFVENVVIINPTRQISFNIGENKYELTLVAKNKNKK